VIVLELSYLAWESNKKVVKTITTGHKAQQQSSVCSTQVRGAEVVEPVLCRDVLGVPSPITFEDSILEEALLEAPARTAAEDS